MNPLEILVTAMAYMMIGDGDVAAEERAKLLAVINKHVKSNRPTTGGRCWRACDG
ncbi:MAG: hypothetical protein OXR84_05610 [Magnetovibrio sp.]|nr:hypothetical protein [Magnetovibrio sp.]